MIIVGIDNSINSPGVVWFKLDENLNIISKEYLGFTSVKKNSNFNIKHFKKDQFCDGIHRYLWMRDVILETVKTHCEGILPDYVAFEDYAFAAIGKVFNIAESTGSLKVKFYENRIPIRLYDPASVKLFFTGFGNSDKVRMLQEYEKLETSEKLNGPINEDIVDAYAICKLLYTEILLRKGKIVVSNLSENVIKVFNRVTKSYPVNLLARDFLQYKDKNENI